MMSLFLLDKVPFKTVLLHNMVRDEDGNKMSKSKGNVIDPLEVINGCTLKAIVDKIENSVLPDNEKKISIKRKKESLPKGIPKCGSDALRFSLLSYVTENRDINLDLNIPISSRNFCTKIWNSYKLVRMTLTDSYVPDYDVKDFVNYSKADLWILAEYNQTVKEVNESIESFKLGSAVDAMNNFWFKKFCDFYLEYSKTVDKADNKAVKENQNVLFYIMESFLRLIHPTMPFLSEDLYQKLPQFKDKAESIMIASYPTVDDRFMNEELLQFEQINTVIRTIRKLCGIVNMPPKTFPKIFLSLTETDSNLQSLVEEYKNYIGTVAKTGEISFISLDNVPKKCLKDVCFNKLNVFVQADSLDKVSEQMQKLIKDIDTSKKAMEKLEKKFNQESYATKVPANVQKRERDAYENHKNKVDSLTETKNVLTTLL